MTLRLATGTFTSAFGTLNRTKLTRGTKPPFDHGTKQLKLGPTREVVSACDSVPLQCESIVLIRSNLRTADGKLRLPGKKKTDKGELLPKREHKST